MQFCLVFLHIRHRPAGERQQKITKNNYKSRKHNLLGKKNLKIVLSLEKPEKDLVTVFKHIKVCYEEEEKSVFMFINKMSWLSVTTRNTTLVQYWDRLHP